MKIQRMTFGDRTLDVRLIEKREWEKISDLESSDIDAALRMLSRFIKAGKTLILPYVAPTDPRVSRITVPIPGVEKMGSANFIAKFAQNVWAIKGRSFIRLSGVGETEFEAKHSFISWFTGDAIPARLMNKNGPLYLCGDPHRPTYFQLDREMIFVEGGDKLSFH